MVAAEFAAIRNRSLQNYQGQVPIIDKIGSDQVQRFAALMQQSTAAEKAAAAAAAKSGQRRVAQYAALSAGGDRDLRAQGASEYRDDLNVQQGLNRQGIREGNKAEQAYYRTTAAANKQAWWDRAVAINDSTANSKRDLAQQFFNQNLEINDAERQAQMEAAAGFGGGGGGGGSYGGGGGGGRGRGGLSNAEIRAGHDSTNPKAADHIITARNNFSGSPSAQRRVARLAEILGNHAIQGGPPGMPVGQLKTQFNRNTDAQIARLREAGRDGRADRIQRRRRNINRNFFAPVREQNWRVLGNQRAAERAGAPYR